MMNDYGVTRKCENCIFVCKFNYPQTSEICCTCEEDFGTAVARCKKYEKIGCSMFCTLKEARQLKVERVLERTRK